MNGSTRTNSRRGAVRLGYAAAVVPIVAWTLHLTLTAALAGEICTHSNVKWIMHVLTAGTAIVCVVCGAYGYALWRRSPSNGDSAGSTRFLGLIAVGDRGHESCPDPMGRVLHTVPVELSLKGSAMARKRDEHREEELREELHERNVEGIEELSEDEQEAVLETVEVNPDPITKREAMEQELMELKRSDAGADTGD